MWKKFLLLGSVVVCLLLTTTRLAMAESYYRNLDLTQLNLQYVTEFYKPGGVLEKLREQLRIIRECRTGKRNDAICYLLKPGTPFYSCHNRQPWLPVEKERCIEPCPSGYVADPLQCGGVCSSNGSNNGDLNFGLILRQDQIQTTCTRVDYSAATIYGAIPDVLTRNISLLSAEDKDWIGELYQEAVNNGYQAPYPKVVSDYVFNNCYNLSQNTCCLTYELTDRYSNAGISTSGVRVETKSNTITSFLQGRNTAPTWGDLGYATWMDVRMAIGRACSDWQQWTSIILEFEKAQRGEYCRRYKCYKCKPDDTDDDSADCDALRRKGGEYASILPSTGTVSLKRGISGQYVAANDSYQSNNSDAINLLQLGGSSPVVTFSNGKCSAGYSVVKKKFTYGSKKFVCPIACMSCVGGRCFDSCDQARDGGFEKNVYEIGTTTCPDGSRPRTRKITNSNGKIFTCETGECITGGGNDDNPDSDCEQTGDCPDLPDDGEELADFGTCTDDSPATGNIWVKVVRRVMASSDYWEWDSVYKFYPQRQDTYTHNGVTTVITYAPRGAAASGGSGYHKGQQKSYGAECFYKECKQTSRTNGCQAGACNARLQETRIVGGLTNSCQISDTYPTFWCRADCLDIPDYRNRGRKVTQCSDDGSACVECKMISGCGPQYAAGNYADCTERECTQWDEYYNCIAYTGRCLQAACHQTSCGGACKMVDGLEDKDMGWGRYRYLRPTLYPATTYGASSIAGSDLCTNTVYTSIGACEAPTCRRKNNLSYYLNADIAGLAQTSPSQHFQEWMRCNRQSGLTGYKDLWTGGTWRCDLDASLKIKYEPKDRKLYGANTCHTGSANITCFHPYECEEYLGSKYKDEYKGEAPDKLQLFIPEVAKKVAGLKVGGRCGKYVNVTSPIWIQAGGNRVTTRITTAGASNLYDACADVKAAKGVGSIGIKLASLTGDKQTISYDAFVDVVDIPELPLCENGLSESINNDNVTICRVKAGKKSSDYPKLMQAGASTVIFVPSGSFTIDTNIEADNNHFKAIVAKDTIIVDPGVGARPHKVYETASNQIICPTKTGAHLQGVFIAKAFEFPHQEVVDSDIVAFNVPKSRTPGDDSQSNSDLFCDRQLVVAGSLIQSGGDLDLSARTFRGCVCREDACDENNGGWDQVKADPDLYPDFNAHVASFVFFDRADFNNSAPAWMKSVLTQRTEVN